MVSADSKTKLLHDAEKYVLHGKIPQAIGEYLKIINSDPNDVLILNTVGDLYLRLGDTLEANGYFRQVADLYVRNNFILKAIAVYKKILNSDAGSLEINQILASLFAKQGLNIDARNQYLRVASLLEKDAKSKESRDCYEKVAEIDPANFKVQHKLAELYLAEGEKEKAQSYLTGAARAQMKAGDFSGALISFQKAVQFDPLDINALKGFVDCCLQTGKAALAVEQLKASLEIEPDSLDLRELLGRSYLCDHNPEAAAKILQTVASMDEARYENLFPVAEAFCASGDYDRAASCLDPILPVLITRRETDRAVRVYELVLQSDPSHVLTLTKLASIFLANNDQTRYLTVLDRLANHYLSRQCPVEALEYLEKILRSDPESEKHQELHRQAFAEAYPDEPYVSPVPPVDMRAETAPMLHREPAPEGKGSTPELVEADLLLNYGMRDKALSLLQNLVSRDPVDKEVRLRLLSILKEEKRLDEAAEQCLLLAALYRKSRNEESAQSYLMEARQLAPEIASQEQDLEAFAQKNGIFIGTPANAGKPSLQPGSEIDLSEDLLDIFYAGGQEAESSVPEPQEHLDGMTEGFPDVPAQPPAKSIQEQLQEVDFYIQLGFHDEALTKLSEISKQNPENPELAARYEKLGAVEPQQAQEPMVIALPGEVEISAPGAIVLPDEEEFGDLDIGNALGDFLENHSDQSQAGADSLAAVDVDAAFAAIGTEKPAPKPKEAAAESMNPAAPVNEMFADLMEEVSSLTDQEIAKEVFEDHFSLGTAYREMDLIEDAIKEFQTALKTLDTKKDGRKVVQCCGMLSTCFLKKGMPRSAVRWCQTGLSVADISSHEALALRYDMGVAHSMAGSNEQALQCFDQIFVVDPEYRDVAQRIDELKGGFERHAP
jgi:tetratricopeptide (TPR) repeat protein